MPELEKVTERTAMDTWHAYHYFPYKKSHSRKIVRINFIYFKLTIYANNRPPTEILVLPGYFINGI